MSETFTSIELSKDNGVAMLVLNRPQRANALNRRMVEEINQALDAVESDDQIRALVVTGAGAAFSAGFDLKEQADRRPTGAEVWREMLGFYSSTILRFWSFSKPTIAAVNGPCMAGAFELALACDLSIASEDAIFGEPELQFGAGIVAMLLPWYVSPKVAKRVILLGEDMISAREALDLGIIGQVTSGADLLAEAVGTARRLARMDPALVRQTKAAINAAYQAMGFEHAITRAVEIDVQIEAEGTKEKHEFLDRLKSDGMQQALRWRRARFDA
jgi:enoyl-CoA hydratase